MAVAESEHEESPLAETVPPEGAPLALGPAPRPFDQEDSLVESDVPEKPRRRSRKEVPHPSAPLTEKLDFVARTLSESQVAELVALYSNPRRMFWINLLMGIGRGLGYGIGIGLLTGVTVYLLQKVIAAHLPYLSDWLATIIHLVDQKSRP